MRKFINIIILNCPHYDGEIKRKPAYHKLVESKKIQSGLAIDDWVAFH